MNNCSTNSVSGNRNQFEKFLLSEYEHIASAHFNMVNSISTFFRFFLLIVSLPLPVLALVLKPSEKGFNSTFIEVLMPYLIIGGTLIAIIGFFVMCYVVNLRFDALLYARQVNGIRDYFYCLYESSNENECQITVLPRSINIPSYFEPGYFLWVVLAISFINSLYYGAAVYFSNTLCSMPLGKNLFIVLGTVIVFIILSLCVYKRLADYRENRYLKNENSQNRS